MSIVPDHPVVNTPKVARGHLSKMSYDDLDPWKAVKDAICANPKDVALYVLPKL